MIKYEAIDDLFLTPKKSNFLRVQFLAKVSTTIFNCKQLQLKPCNAKTMQLQLQVSLILAEMKLQLQVSSKNYMAININFG